MSKKKHCYYISEDGYDSLNDHEGRWKHNPDAEVDFEKYYPENASAKIKDNEFNIGADFELGGWGIHGNIELFETWVEDYYNGDISNIHDEIPEEEEEDDGNY